MPYAYEKHRMANSCIMAYLAVVHIQIELRMINVHS